MVVDYEHIDSSQWDNLIAQSSTASWFQTPAAYSFFCSVSDELEPFCFGWMGDDGLKAVCVGYIVGKIFPRAIIQGGPLLADDISEQEVEQLLKSVTAHLENKAIYIETRNFSDYSGHRDTFERCGYEYVPHYDFLQTTATIDLCLDRNRRRNIQQSEMSGLKVVSNKDEITSNDIDQFYWLLVRLYRRKLHLPLFSKHFFEQLISQPDCQFFIVYSRRDVVLGGEVCVGLKNKVVYDWYGCGNNDLKYVHPSEFVTYVAIKWAHQNGFPTFDFMGAGSPDQPYGVRDFKARFGGQQVEYGRFLHVVRPVIYKFGKCGVKLLKRWATMCRRR